MAEVRSFRDTRDLVEIVADLTRRLELLEKTRRIGYTSIDGGELVMRAGDIVVRDVNDKRVMQIEHGQQPAIRFYPSTNALDDYGSVIFGWESDQGSVLQLSIMLADNNTQDGGKILLQQDAVYVAFQPNVGQEAYIAFNTVQEASIVMRGTWWDGGQINEQDAIIVGRVPIVAGFGAYAHTFATPFDIEPLILYSLDSPAGAVTHSMVATDPTGFTVSWSGTTSKTLYWAALRLG